MGAAEEPTGRFGRNRKGNVVLTEQEVRFFAYFNACNGVIKEIL
jgi:hypothetical protein